MTQLKWPWESPRRGSGTTRAFGDFHMSYGDWEVDGEPIGGELLNEEETSGGKPGWRVRDDDGDAYVVAEEFMKLEGIYVRCHNSGLSVLCRRGVVAGKITLPAQHLPTYMKQIPPRPPLVSWKSVKCFFYASSPRGPHAVF